MKLIDADALLSWLWAQKVSLEGSKVFLGNLFWTGADVTYQKVIDRVHDLKEEADKIGYETD